MSESSPPETFLLLREQRVPHPRDEVFAFFSDPRNLGRITPDWIHFRMERPLTRMTEGTIIDYRLRIRGIPLRWRTRIAEYEPPHRFVDVQVRGPYALWRHEHTFEAVEGGTLVRDRVEYALHWWSGGRTALGRLVHGLVVRPDIERIFDHRRAVLDGLLDGAHAGSSDRTISGARVATEAVP